MRANTAARARMALVICLAFPMEALGFDMTRTVSVPFVPPVVTSLDFLFASASAPRRPDTVTSWGRRFFCRAGAAFLRVLLCVSVDFLGSAVLRFFGARNPPPLEKLSMEVWLCCGCYDAGAFFFSSASFFNLFCFLF